MSAVLGLVGVIAGLLPLWPVFGSVSFVVVVLGGVLLGSGVATLARWRRWPWWSVLPGLIVVFAVFGVPLAVPTAALWHVVPTWAGEIQLFSSVVTGWKQLVTITPPVGDYAGLLVPVLVMSLVASAAVILLVKPGRTRPFGVVPGIAALSLSVWLGVGDLSLAVPAGGIVAAASLGLFVTSSRANGWRRGLATVATVVTVIIAAGVGVLAGGHPALWRDRVTPLLDDSSLPSPLSDYRAYIIGDQATLPMLTASGIRAGEMLSLATLSRYDGITYSVGAPEGDFTRQSGFATPHQSDETATTISIDQLTGPWLPLPGTFSGLDATSQSFDALYYSQTASTAVDMNGLSSGVRYAVSGKPLATATLQSLTDAEPGQSSTSVLDVPSGVEAYALAHSTAGDSAGQRLVDVLSSLTTNGYLSHGQEGQAPSRSGHSAERITALLTDRLMVGDAEQYAVAAALLAQQVGFPARVVVGFVMPESGDLVHGSDMSVWVQVATTDGWVSIDPTPAYRPIPEAPPDNPQKVSPPQPAIEPPPAEASQIRDNTAPQSDERDPVKPADPWGSLIINVLGWLGWILLAAVILMLPPLSIVAVKAWRRRRRRDASDPRAGVIGAGLQLGDDLRDARVTVTRSTTNRELVALAGRDESSLVSLMDRAQYSGDRIDRVEVDRAWSEVESLERQLRSSASRGELWRRRLSLRTFVRRDGRSLR